MSKLNISIDIPEWVRWMTIDPNGKCYGFENKPEPDYGHMEWTSNRGVFIELYVGAPPKDWTQELYEWK